VTHKDPAGAQDLAAIYELAHVEAVRALDRQFAMVETLRLRAGLAFSAGLVALTVLSPQRITEGIGLGEWIALISFTLAGLAALAVLWPREWEWQVAATSIVADVEVSASAMSLAGVHSELAREKEASRRVNEPAVGHLATCLRTAYTLCGIEILALLVNLV